MARHVAGRRARPTEFKEKLQPLGYKLKVLIVDWPNGPATLACVSV